MSASWVRCQLSFIELALPRHWAWRELRRDGLNESVEVKRDANGMLDLHSHPFQSRVLIVASKILITVSGKETRYVVGDVFNLGNGMEHIEKYGPQVVTYLVGRK